LVNLLFFCFILQLPKIRLADGIPQMEQVISNSGATIPLESEHSPCEHEINPSFTVQCVSRQVKNYQSSLRAHIIVGQTSLHYTTEADVLMFVKLFLRDVANAMGIPLEMASDFGIKHVMPDICVRLGSRLVSVAEIMKPQENVVEMPTVLGRLFDQMMLVEGFYMSGPAIGIVTTLKDWLFCWFPADSGHFSSALIPFRATTALLTPPKACTSVGAVASPPRETSSKSIRWSHGVGLSEDIRDDPDEFVLTDEPVRRKLQTSSVISGYTDYDLLLEHLCSAFTRMTQVNLNECRGVPGPVFTFHKGRHARPNISFQPIEGMPFTVESIRSNIFPRAGTTMLLALEDLGRGSSEKAWLCCTLSASPSLCVLKSEIRAVMWRGDCG
jgi:hypothetical protein